VSTDRFEFDLRIEGKHISQLADSVKVNGVEGQIMNRATEYLEVRFDNSWGLNSTRLIPEGTYQVEVGLSTGYAPYVGNSQNNRLTIVPGTNQITIQPESNTSQMRIITPTEPSEDPEASSSTETSDSADASQEKKGKRKKNK